MNANCETLAYKLDALLQGDLGVFGWLERNPIYAKELIALAALVFRLKNAPKIVPRSQKSIESKLHQYLIDRTFSKLQNSSGNIITILFMGTILIIVLFIRTYLF